MTWAWVRVHELARSGDPAGADSPAKIAVTATDGDHCATGTAPGRAAMLCTVLVVVGCMVANTAASMAASWATAPSGVPGNPVGGDAYFTLIPCATSSATAGDHIDSTTTSFEAMRLTDSLKFAQ